MYSRIARIGVVLAFLSPIALVFQNCGKGFVAGNEELNQQASLAPEVNITEVPAPLINSTTATITFETRANAVSSIALVECALDEEPYVPCANGAVYQDLDDGDHRIRVRVSDSRGNITEIGPILFRVDATAPEISVNMMPPTVSGANTATIGFSAADNGSGIDITECSLDNAAFANCQSPVQLANLAQGPHTFRVRARDVAGNFSEIATVSWTVDLTAPVLAFTQTPMANSNSRTATFAFTATDDGQPVNNIECQLNNGGFAACTSPVTYNNLVDNVHTFMFRARDLAGNLSAPASYTWRVDTAAPTIATLTGPSSETTDIAATFQFTAIDGGSGVATTQCRLDNGNFANCTSPVNYQNLAQGSHTFAVRAIDSAGNIGPERTHRWTIDNVTEIGVIGGRYTTLKARGNVLYVLDSVGLEAWERVGTTGIVKRGRANARRGQFFYSSSDLEIYGNVAVAYCPTTVALFDISQPLAPRLAYQFQGSYSSAIIVNNRIVLIGYNTVDSYDITNVNAPALIGTTAPFASNVIYKTVGNNIVSVGGGTFSVYSYNNNNGAIARLASINIVSSGGLMHGGTILFVPSVVNVAGNNVLVQFYIYNNGAYVADEIASINIADPLQPRQQQVITIPATGTLFNANIYGNRYYTAGGNSVLEFDITNPANISFAARYTSFSASPFYIDNNVVYAVTNNRLQVYNLTSSGQVQTVAADFEPPKSLEESYSRFLGKNGNIITVKSGSYIYDLNVANPATPVITSSLSLPSPYAEIYGDYIIANAGIYRRVNNNIQLVTSANLSGRAFAANGRLYTVAPYTTGGLQLRVMDIGNLPNTPVTLGSLDIADIPYSTRTTMALAGGNLLINMSGYFINVDVSNPAAPVVRQRIVFRDPSNDILLQEGGPILVDGNTVYTSTRNGNEVLAIYSMSGGMLVQQSLTYSNNVSMASSLIKRGNNLITSGRNGIRVFNVANPASPVLLSDYSNSRLDVGVIFVEGQTVYAIGAAGFKILTNVPGL